MRKGELGVDFLDKKFTNKELYKALEQLFGTPSHYSGKSDVIDFCEKQFTDEEIEGFYKFNIIKYATRLGRKDDVDKELHKIMTYAYRYRKYLEGKKEMRV